jgi:hypothetical protein
MAQSNLLSFVKPIKTTTDNNTEQLLKHGTGAKHDGVSFVDTQGRRYRGLTDRLRKCFYDDYKPVKRKSGYSSMLNGTRVHRQLYHTIHCTTTAKCDCKVKTRKLSKLTEDALRIMKEELDITPVDSEVPILCKDGNLCTSLDIIGYRWKGTPKQRSTIVSIKTGYEIGCDHSKTTMNPPYHNVKSSPRNHNQLQALAEKLILEKQYNMMFPEYWIIYLCKSKPSTWEPLAKWLGDKKTQDLFYEFLCKQ